MIMDDSEISLSYRTAKNQSAQIRVLADLNSCSSEEMRQYLIKLGLLQSDGTVDFDYMRAAELYSGGMTDLDISECLGCSQATVKKWRKSKRFKANPDKRKAVTRKPTQQKQRKVGQQILETPAAQYLTVSALAEIFQHIREIAPDARVYSSGDALVSSVLMNSIYERADGSSESEVFLQGETRKC